jgi:hypothetical protein
MSAEYDATEFVDNDFQAAHKTAYTGSVNTPSAATRAPSREEVDAKMGDTQQKLAELKRVQEELERERAGLEETRRRQLEYHHGRAETIQNLTRGIGLLTEAEFAARRDAEQMAKSLADMQVALAKVEATNDQHWTRETFAVELTRALTAIENARMEWNSARLKFPVLSGIQPAVESQKISRPAADPFAGQSLGRLCKLGLALTWPLVAAVLLFGLLMLRFMRH